MSFSCIKKIDTWIVCYLTKKLQSKSTSSTQISNEICFVFLVTIHTTYQLNSVVGIDPISFNRPLIWFINKIRFFIFSRNQLCNNCIKLVFIKESKRSQEKKRMNEWRISINWHFQYQSLSKNLCHLTIVTISFCVHYGSICIQYLKTCKQQNMMEMLKLYHSMTVIGESERKCLYMYVCRWMGKEKKRKRKKCKKNRWSGSQNCRFFFLLVTILMLHWRKTPVTNIKVNEINRYRKMREHWMKWII